MKYKPTVKAKAPQDSTLRGVGTFDWGHPLISAQKRLATLLSSDEDIPKQAGKTKKVKCPLCGRRVNVKNNRLSPHYANKDNWYTSVKTSIQERFRLLGHPKPLCTRLKLIE